MADITVRMGEDDVDAALSFRAFTMMHAEGCVPGPLDNLKTLTNVFRIVNGPNSVMLMAFKDEELVGVLALYEEGFWWNHERHLGDKGFYVLPEHRDGAAFDALLEAAMNLSDDLGLPVYITVNNGQRKRGGRSKWERRGMTLGYQPQGAVIAHTPGEN